MHAVYSNMIFLRLALLLLAILCAWASPCKAQEISAEQAQTLIDLAQEYFWGNAVDEEGQVIQPESEEERVAPLIPREDAIRVVNDALPYGHALWCGVDHRPTYLVYMQLERTKEWETKEIAFIGMLFGVTQGHVRSVMESSGRECDSEEREGIGDWLDEERVRLQELMG